MPESPIIRASKHIGMALIIAALLYGGLEIARAAARSSPFSIGQTTDPGADAEPCGPLDANCFPAVYGVSTTTANTWSALQTFGNNASLGGATFNVSSLGTGQLLQYDGTNWVNTATSSLGLPTFSDLSSYSNFGYLFPSNATSTALSFTGGLTSYASTTIGDGSTTGGLTISGNATTTGAVSLGSTLSIGNGSGGSVPSFSPGSFSRLTLGSSKLQVGGDYNVLSLSSAMRLAWGSASTADPTYNDTYLVRNSAGVVEINNGTTGQYRDLQIRSLNPTSGNVGIGTTNPGVLLSISGAHVSGQGMFRLDGTTHAYATYNAAGTNDSGFFFNRGGATKWYTNNTGTTDAFNIASRDPSDNIRFTILQNGNVGISTTSPFAKLSVTGSGTGTGTAFQVADSTNAPKFTVLDNGNVGIGTTSPYTQLALQEGAGTGINLSPSNRYISIESSTSNSEIRFLRDGGLNARVQSSAGTSLNMSTLWGGNEVSKIDLQRGSNAGYITLSTGSSGVTERVRIDSLGNVGIGTTTPWRKLAVTGTVGFDGLTNDGTGNYLCLTGNNEVTYSATACTGVSSREFKHAIEDIVGGLDTVLALRPVSFVYNDDVSPNDQSTHLGFVAEEVDEIDPNLAAYDSAGKVRSVKYLEFIPVIIKALQELSARIDQLAQVGIAGIKHIFAEKVTTDELCVGETCVTEDELKALLLNADIAPVDHSSGGSQQEEQSEDQESLDEQEDVQNEDTGSDQEVDGEVIDTDTTDGEPVSEPVAEEPADELQGDDESQVDDEPVENDPLEDETTDEGIQADETIDEEQDAATDEGDGVDQEISDQPVSDPAPTEETL